MKVYIGDDPPFVDVAVKVTGVPAVEHIEVEEALSDTVGTNVGFTVIVNDVDDPEQPLAFGVTVIVAVIGVEPALVAVKAGIFPFPLAASPIAVLLFVQLYVVPLPEKFIAVVGELLHTV